MWDTVDIIDRLRRYIMVGTLKCIGQIGMGIKTQLKMLIPTSLGAVTMYVHNGCRKAIFIQGLIHHIERGGWWCFIHENGCVPPYLLFRTGWSFLCANGCGAFIDPLWIRQRLPLT